MDLSIRKHLWPARAWQRDALRQVTAPAPEAGAEVQKVSVLKGRERNKSQLL
jgi:hypothetical protein